MDRLHYEMHKGINLINQGYEIRFKIWQEEVLFSWHWWFGIGLSLVSWIIWFLIRKRNSSFFGFFEQYQFLECKIRNYKDFFEEYKKFEETRKLLLQVMSDHR